MFSCFVPVNLVPSSESAFHGVILRLHIIQNQVAVYFTSVTAIPDYVAV